jgi:D-alanine--poly(phosphoribitol) ligase subunit 1
VSEAALQVLATAARQPDRAAVVSDEGTISYGEFAQRIRQVAAALVPHFERAPTPAAAIALTQGADAYAAMFASLLAGGFYVPLNLSAPPEKLSSIISQVKPAVVIAEGEDSVAAGSGVPRLLMRDLPKHALGEPRAPHRLAYVMFTSGSTGVPKGVMISQPALSNYLAWIRQSIRPTADDRWSQHPNIGFDLSVLDIYGALPFGAALYPLVSESARMLPAQWIRKHQLTIWNSVPSVVSLMMRAGQTNGAHLSSVRLFTFCGEPLLPEHVAALFDAAPASTVQNTYGPTEATVSCTELKLTKRSWHGHARSTVALGEPISGMQLLLEGPEAPLRGELVITGPQLADGYWNDPAQTDGAFRSLGAGGSGRRGYFTGDMAERVDGNLYFQVRRDQQVKIHGFRVELDDVNAALRRCGLAQSAVAMIGGSLHAFVEVAALESFDAGALKQKLLQHLDSYAIPSQFHAWDRLPRNANDKLDLQAMIRIAQSQKEQK